MDVILNITVEFFSLGFVHKYLFTFHKCESDGVAEIWRWRFHFNNNNVGNELSAACGSIWLCHISPGNNKHNAEAKQHAMSFLTRELTTRLCALQ